MDVEQLFKKLANDYTGRCELVMARMDGSVDLDFVNDEGVLQAKANIKMVEVGGKQFAQVKDRMDKKGPEVLVSPLTSAVLAVALR